MTSKLTRSPFLVLLSVLSVGLLLDCSGGRGTAAPSAADAGRASTCASTSAAPLLPGKLLETGNKTIDLWDHGRRTPIACASNATTFFGHPTFSPDGQTIAYSVSTVPTGQGQDWGDDIYTANADGSASRLILQHDAAGVLIDSLAWSQDGSALIFGYFRAVYDSTGRFTTAIYQVNRLTLAGGTVTTLLKDASQASLSWDGKQIVYVSYPSSDYNISALAIANSDGSGAHTLLSNQAGFQGYFAPHLSPDGKQVVFAAIGGPVGRGPHPYPAPRTLQSLARRFAVPRAEADGSPYEVWVANLDGSNLHPVANLREDLPYPLWSSDGKQILFLGAAALYLANANGSEVKQIDKGVAHGQIDWLQR